MVNTGLIFRTGVVLFILFLGSCGEDLDKKELHISTFLNVNGKILDTYQYRKKKLYYFTTTDQATNKVTGSSKFYYTEDRVSRIVSDSATARYTLTEIYYSDLLPTKDSVFTVVNKDKTFVSTRLFVFNEAAKLQKIISPNSANSSQATEVEFTWSGANISEATTYNVNASVRSVTQVVKIQYEGKKSIFPGEFAYFYTLKGTNLYRLSENNPTTVSIEGQKDQTFTYTYNKFGYPFGFTDGANAKFSAAYLSFGN
jgi:hypothetical protein